MATGVPARGRAAAYEETVAVLRACWGPDPVEFEGEHFTVPLARIGPKPLSPLSLYGGGVVRPAIERAARITDGLTLAFRAWDSCIESIKWYRDAGGTGRIILRAGPMKPHPMLQGPPAFTEDTILDDPPAGRGRGCRSGRLGSEHRRHPDSRPAHRLPPARQAPLGLAESRRVAFFAYISCGC